MIELAISLGLLLSLIFNEAFGLATGGLVVPGYIALQLGAPDPADRSLDRQPGDRRA